MLAFHNSQEIKDKYLNRVFAHQAADNLIRGTGWKDGKGCAVGCTLENYDHSQYPIELGIPEWLARVEDSLFEGMSLEKSKTWPSVFLDAIKVGDDLERIKAPFLIMILKSALGSFDNEAYPDVTAAINQSITLWQRADIGSNEFNEVARAAAEVARAAAWAAEAAEAAEVARAARAAAWAAEAAEVARAARAAAGEDKFNYFADELIKIIKEQAGE